MLHHGIVLYVLEQQMGGLNNAMDFVDGGVCRQLLAMKWESSLGMGGSSLVTCSCLEGKKQVWGEGRTKDGSPTKVEIT